MEEIFVCQNSLEGVLTAIYRIYEEKCNGPDTRVQIGEDDLRLFARYHQVDTAPALAEKVASTIQRRFGSEAWEAVSYALCAEDRGKGQAVYRTVAAGLSGRIRGPLMQALANEDVRRVFELSRHVHNEAHRMIEFLRFKEVEGGMLFARIEPAADVTALIMPHFADRFPLENFVIADTGRGLAGIHTAKQPWVIVRYGSGLREQVESAADRYSQMEQEMAELFRHFCDALGIKERRNIHLQQQLLPLKYRRFMTEFEEKEGV